MKRPRASGGYNGYKLEDNATVDRVAYSSVSAREFFERFVDKRRPCVIEGGAGIFKEGFSLDLIRKKAGDVAVDVEFRANDKEKFGQGKKKRMTFEQFMGQLKDGNLYMTTQKDRGKAVSEPLCRVVPDFVPRHMPLAGSLALANLNMWCGNSKTGSSTPLHVDFHDNFYVLLSGLKEFTVFPPSEASKLNLRGKVRKVFPNGLINFEGFETNSDGSTPYAVAQKKLELAEEAGDEDAIEHALQSLLDLGEGFEEDGASEQRDEEPNHFCQIAMADALKRPHLLFQLKAGECLYLPCGWFHEVKSMSADANFHLAVNYWYHPPDQPGSFADPYSTIAFK